MYAWETLLHVTALEYFEKDLVARLSRSFSPTIPIFSAIAGRPREQGSQQLKLKLQCCHVCKIYCLSLYIERNTQIWIPLIPSDV